MFNSIIGYLDMPIKETTVFTPFLQAMGWALSKNNSNILIEILIDDKPAGKTKLSMERPDIAKAYPSIKDALHSGFLFRIDLQYYQDGTHFLKAIATDGKEKKVIGISKFELYYKKFENFSNKIQDEYLDRWKSSKPDAKLTWDLNITGDAFVELAKKFNAFSPEKKILELGPGYGRILSSIISKKLPFKSYTGIDISEKNMEVLKKKFNQNNINFTIGEFTEITLEEKFDTVLSSLTLKHQYPTFYKSLKNISQFVKNDGLIIFDVRENKENELKEPDFEKLEKLGPYLNTLEGDGVFVGYYARSEVLAILKKNSSKIN